jgi:hypothetical protein
MPRYLKTCPACKETINPAEAPIGDSFPCPTCGQWLTYGQRYSSVIWVISIVVAIVITLRLGYRDATFIFIATCASWVFGLLGIFVVGLLIPPPLVRVKGKPFDKTVSFHLTDKPESDKKTNP